MGSYKVNNLYSGLTGGKALDLGHATRKMLGKVVGETGHFGGPNANQGIDRGLDLGYATG